MFQSGRTLARWRRQTHPLKFMSDSAALLALSSELEPPPEPKSKSKKSRADPTNAPKLKRGPPRPHRRLPEDVLTTRVDRLRKRLERARKQVFHFCRASERTCAQTVT